LPSKYCFLRFGSNLYFFTFVSLSFIYVIVTSIKAAESFRIDFSNTAIAFGARSDKSIKRAYWLFSMIKYNWIVKTGPILVNLGFRLRLPIEGLIRKTVFRHFCGGISINDCDKTIARLASENIGSILDYSVEGADDEKLFDQTADQIIQTIEKAKGNKSIPFAVFKVTGIARNAILEKVSKKEPLSESEKFEYDRLVFRFNAICESASKCSVRLFVDAEESWLQNAIDDLTELMMMEYNKSEVIIFNTIQLYRHDRLEYLKQGVKNGMEKGYKLGYKLVRGAYMEKERERAKDKNYPSPIHVDKNAVDIDYNEALKFCLDHIQHTSICAGTHNEESSLILAKMMQEKNISIDHHHVWFSQLLGMSDHISVNMAYAGFNVAKYVPYGPVKSVLPYLFRRAEENTSIKGQTGRELQLLKKEMKRRNLFTF